MKDFLSLRVLDKFKAIFTMLGVEYSLMRKMLQVKLTLDSRRVTTAIMNYNNTEETNMFLKSMAIQALFGLFPMLLVLIGGSPLIGMSAYFGMLMFLLATTMISDFSAVLLDVSDRTILFTKPINTRTINMAKFMHMLIYLAFLCGAIGGPGIIAATIKYGLAYGLLMIVALVFVCILNISLTSLLYTILLKYYDGEKLKDVINVFQIVVMIMISVGYQLMSRMFGLVGRHIVFVPSWWTYFIPPFWFAAPFELLVVREVGTPVLMLASMAIIVPLLSMVFHTRVVAPAFERNLAKLSGTERVRNYRKPLRKRAFDRLTSLFSYNKVERAVVKFANTMLTRERSTKLRMYPAIALSLMLPAIMVLSLVVSKHTLGEALKIFGQGNRFLIVYVSAALLSTLSSMLFFSDSFRGAWVLKALPVESTAQVTKGALKGLILTYIVPVIVFLYVATLPLLGFARTLDFVVILLSAIFIAVLLANMFKEKMPFSEKFVQAQAGTAWPTFVAMILVGVIAGIHVLIFEHRWLVLGLGLALLGALTILWQDGIRVAFGRNRMALVVVSIMTLVLIGTLTGIYYHRVGNAVVATIISGTLQTLPDGFAQRVDASVRVGGDNLIIYTMPKNISMRTCFYTDEALTVAAAHSFDMEPAQYRMQVNNGLSVRAELLSVGSGGVVVSGISPPTDSPILEIACPSEIIISTDAILVHSDGDIPVMLLGYQFVDEHLALVLHPTDENTYIGPGFSGSPIVQNDRLIGFLAAVIKPGFRYKGPRIGFARLAIEVYMETIGSTLP